VKPRKRAIKLHTLPKLHSMFFSGPGHVMGDELLVCASLFFIKRRRAARRVRLSFLIKAGVSPA
jgi:hypothetical protein